MSGGQWVSLSAELNVVQREPAELFGTGDRVNGHELGRVVEKLVERVVAGYARAKAASRGAMGRGAARAAKQRLALVPRCWRWPSTRPLERPSALRAALDTRAEFGYAFPRWSLSPLARGVASTAP